MEGVKEIINDVLFILFYNYIVKKYIKLLIL